MDPNATLKRIQEAIDTDDLAEAREARTDLVNWLAGGGFEPNWQAYPTASAFARYEQKPLTTRS